jgi:ribosomal-protein-alanine N-acetyltransferase
MNQIPEIVTEQLTLRGFSLTDARDVFAYASNPNVLRYTTGRTPTSIADSEKFVHGLMNAPAGAFAWAVRLKNAPTVIGAVEFGIGDGTEGSIHYALAEEHWNKGLMTDACRAVFN